MPAKTLPIGLLRSSGGNIGSVARALTRLKIDWRFIDDPADLDHVSGLIFPGAGAAPPAMESLKKIGWIEAIKSYDQPFLGLCLGMQLLFDYSEEGSTDCLGIIPGRVRMLPDDVIRPHMGWNQLDSGQYAYFVHSYVCEPHDKRVITMTTQYGTTLCAGVCYKNFFGVQWHPEKSAAAGDQLLASFALLCE